MNNCELFLGHWGAIWCLWGEWAEQTCPTTCTSWENVWGCPVQTPWGSQVSFVPSSWEKELWCLRYCLCSHCSLLFLLYCHSIKSILKSIGPWKKKCLADFGIVTQCIAPTRVNDQYLTNVLLKINAKVRFMNLRFRWYMCSLSKWVTLI